MGGVTEIEGTTMAILGGQCAGQDLTNQINHGVGTCAEFSDDLELFGKAKVGAGLGDGRGREVDVVVL